MPERTRVMVGCERRRAPNHGRTPLLIAGLGNPGAECARNRHNARASWRSIRSHESYDFGPWRAALSRAFISEGTLGKRKVYLLKPATYMNDSGQSIGLALRFFKLPLSALVVMHDEIDLAAAEAEGKDRWR